MICRYCYKKSSKSKPSRIKLMINGGSVSFEKHKKYLKLGSALIILPITSVLSPGNARKNGNESNHLHIHT